MAIVFSFALTAFGGYVLYQFSGQGSESQLSWFVHHLFNPCIAVFVGLLVGWLSKNHAGLTAIVGLTPWALCLNIYGTRPSAAAVLTLGELMALGAVAAVLSLRTRNKKA
jgi:hypothetical protein